METYLTLLEGVIEMYLLRDAPPLSLWEVLEGVFVGTLNGLLSGVVMRNLKGLF